MGQDPGPEKIVKEKAARLFGGPCRGCLPTSGRAAHRLGDGQGALGKGQEEGGELVFSTDTGLSGSSSASPQFPAPPPPACSDVGGWERKREGGGEEHKDRDHVHTGVCAHMQTHAAKLISTGRHGGQLPPCCGLLGWK